MQYVKIDGDGRRGSVYSKKYNNFKFVFVNDPFWSQVESIHNEKGTPLLDFHNCNINFDNFLKIFTWVEAARYFWFSSTLTCFPVIWNTFSMLTDSLIPQVLRLTLACWIKMVALLLILQYRCSTLKMVARRYSRTLKVYHLSMMHYFSIYLRFIITNWTVFAAP